MYFVRVGKSEQKLVYIRYSIFLLNKWMDESIIVQKKNSGVRRAAGAQNCVKIMERRRSPRKGCRERLSKDRFALFTLTPETHRSPFFINHSFIKLLLCARNCTQHQGCNGEWTRGDWSLPHRAIWLHAHTAEQIPGLHPLSYSWQAYVLTPNSRKSLTVPFIQLPNLACFEAKLK